MNGKVINEIVMPMVLQVVECHDATRWVVSAGDNDGERMVFPVEIRWRDHGTIPVVSPGDYVRATVTTTQYVTPGRQTLVAHSTLSGIQREFLRARDPVVLDNA